MTPRTAEEIMCVVGEVTWIEMKPAMQMRKPKTPCAVRRHHDDAHVRSTRRP